MRQAAIASAISSGGSLSEPSARARVGGRQHAIADGGKIARAAARRRASRDKRAGEIGRRLQARARIGARRRVGDKARHRIEPSRDLRRIGQRRREPLRQQARAGGGYRAVDRIEQRAAPLARSVRISSRLPRVAWSIAIVAPALSRNGGDRGGRLPICVRST